MISRYYRILPAVMMAVFSLSPCFSQSNSKPRQAADSKQKMASFNDGTSIGTNDAAPANSTADIPTRKNGFSEYRIGEQDVLNITVWREPELSGAVMVRPDGMITLPLVNDVHAAGLTPDELKDMLTEKLRSFLNLPQVTVAVREINSRKVFIIGQVGHEGSFRINSTTTVLQIIAEAGGLREFANRKGIYVLRKENGAQTRLSFNYDHVIRGKDPKENILLRPGDTIVVP